MTKQHKATPDDWAQQWDWANRSVFSDSSCIIELRARIEALEVRQQPQQDKLDRLIAIDRDDPAGSLVERIKRRLIKGIGGTWEETSCDVIREVAAWLKEKGYSTLQAEALTREANQ